MKLNAPGVAQGVLAGQQAVTAEDERKKNDAYKMQEMQAREQAMNYQAFQQSQAQAAAAQAPINNDVASIIASYDPNAPAPTPPPQPSGPPPVTAAPAQQPQMQPPPQQGAAMPPPGGQAPAPAPGQASQPAQPPRPIPQYNTVPGMAQAGPQPPSAPPRMAPPGGQPTPTPQQSQPQQGPMPPPGSPQATEQMKRQNWLKQNLQGKGYTPAQIQAALGSPEAKAAMTQQREDAKFALDTRKQNFEEAEKKTADEIAKRTADRQDKVETETGRHNKAEEGISRANTGQSAAQLKETVRYHNAQIEKMEKVGTEKEMPATMKKSVQLDIAENRQALAALAGLKSSTGSPFFNLEKPGVMSSMMGKAATPEDMQKYDVYANRIAVSLASIQSMGRGQVSDSKVREAKKLVPVVGDSEGVIKVKLAQIKKITDMADNVLKGQNPESEGQTGGQDAQAVTWAKAHPKDPRAKQIMEHNGG